MALTPLDAEKAKFRSGFRGYAREEVERFRAGVVAALEEHIARTEQLSARVAELEGQLARYREKEDLLKDSIVLAQRTCDELIATAHQKADAIRREALLEGDDIRRELAELRSQREQFEYAFHGLLSGFIHRLEQGNPRLAPGPEHPRLGGGEPRDAAPEAVGEAPPPPRPANAEAGSAAAQVTPAQHPVEPTPRREAPPAERRPVPPHAASRGESAAGAEVDRDADILDFSAALDRAPVAQPEWLREEPAPAEAAEPPAEDPDPPEDAAPAGDDSGAEPQASERP